MLDSTVLACRLVAAVLPPEGLMSLGEGRSETHLGTRPLPCARMPPAPKPAARVKKEQVPWGRLSALAATLVIPLGFWKQEVRSLLEVGSGWLWVDFRGVDMGSRVSYYTRSHESWLWAVRILSSIDWVPNSVLGILSFH